MPLRLAREESTREHRVDSEPYNAPALALTQESNNFNVHKSDSTQLHEYADVLIVHLSLYVADIGRLNSTTELQGGPGNSANSDRVPGTDPFSLG
jgi:hypothetical protein